MPDYIIFENWPLSLRLKEAHRRTKKLSSVKEIDERTLFKLRIVSIIDVLLRELEEDGSS